MVECGIACIHVWMFLFVENPDWLHLTVIAIINFTLPVKVVHASSTNKWYMCGMCVSVHVRLLCGFWA